MELRVHLGSQAGLIKSLVGRDELGVPQERDGQLGSHRTLTINKHMQIDGDTQVKAEVCNFLALFQFNFQSQLNTGYC